MEKLEFHEYANIFPLIKGPEFEGLKKDIKENGLIDPVILYEGKILDGRNRYLACGEVGVKPDFTEFEGVDPLSYVISLNLHRRHLNESQRAMVAARMANLTQADAARIKHDATANLQSQTRAEAAEKLSVSERSVNTAKKVQSQCIPEVIEKVEQGALAVSAAAEIAKEEPKKQQEIIKKLSNGEAKNVKQAKRQIDHKERVSVEKTPESDDIRLYHGDCLEVIKNIEREINLVITDPPYGIETHNTRGGTKDYKDGEDYALELMDKLCELLKEKCSSDAHLYFFSGYTNAWRFKQILEKYFYVQDNPLIWVKENHTMCDFSKAYPNKHEYIWFCKNGEGRNLLNCVPDVITEKRQNETCHSAEKPVKLIEKIIEQSGYSKDLVLDPFMGSGSTGIASKNKNMNFIGIELDEEWFKLAKSRII